MPGTPRAAAAAIFAMIASATNATAADIRVLSVGSVQIATKAIAKSFAQEAGHRVVFTIVSPNLIAGRLKANPYDMLIASVPVVAALDKAGALRAGSRAPLSRAGIG
ncbi:MAG: substrate-binding domain-containing protein, partial [Xanthobacteraceae bacterium]